MGVKQRRRGKARSMDRALISARDLSQQCILGFNVYYIGTDMDGWKLGGKVGVRTCMPC